MARPLRRLERSVAEKALAEERTTALRRVDARETKAMLAREYGISREILYQLILKMDQTFEGAFGSPKLSCSIRFFILTNKGIIKDCL